METLAIDPVNIQGFNATPTYDGKTIRLALKGSADLNSKPMLDAMLEKMHPEVLRLAVREVVIDLNGLEFMNSSCFKSFVSWIGKDQDLEPEKQYKLRFLQNARMHWQSRSLNALRCFAVELIVVEV